MAGRQRSLGLLGALAVVGLIQPAACNDPATASSISEETLALALAPVSGQLIAELVAFQDDLAVLDAALVSWRLALDTTDGAAELDVARAAYLDAMETWQHLEVMQIGPLGSSLTAVGGEDLRDEVYSWPDAVSGCRVDTETVEALWDDADFISTNLVNSYGLDALEHLLFASTDTVCPTQVNIQTQWDALGVAGVQSNRADYSRALVAHLDGVASDLEVRWSGDLGMAFAGGTAPWTTRIDALSALYDALFYLETEGKDRKVGTPMGLRDCTADCAVLVEGQLSGHSIRWIHANLVAARALASGTDTDGLDALLVEVGHGDLAAALDLALADAMATAESLDGPLDVLIVEDTAAVQRLYDDLKVVTDLIRGDLATVLLLEIPSEAAGDND